MTILMPPNDHLCSLCPRGEKNIQAEHRRSSGMPLHRIRLIAFFSNFGLSRGNVFKRKRVKPKQRDHSQCNLNMELPQKLFTVSDQEIKRNVYRISVRTVKNHMGCYKTICMWILGLKGFTKD